MTNSSLIEKSCSLKKTNSNKFKKHAVTVGLFMALIMGSQVSHALTLTNGGSPPSDSTDSFGGFFSGLFDPITAIADFDSGLSNVQLNYDAIGSGLGMGQSITITGDVEVFFSDSYDIPTSLTGPYIPPNVDRLNGTSAIFTYDITYLDDITGSAVQIITSGNEVSLKATADAIFSGSFTYDADVNSNNVGVDINLSANFIGSDPSDESMCDSDPIDTGDNLFCVLALAVPPGLFIDDVDNSLTSSGDLIFNALVDLGSPATGSGLDEVRFAHATFCHNGDWRNDTGAVDNMDQCNAHVGVLAAGMPLYNGEFSVPTPGTLALMGFGLLGLIVSAKRKTA